MNNDINKNKEIIFDKDEIESNFNSNSNKIKDWNNKIKYIEDNLNQDNNNLNVRIIEKNQI